MVQGSFKWHQYQVVGRHLPTDKMPSPTVYRMKVWAEDKVKAESKFWYFLKKLRRVKKANGQILSVNEIFEKRPTTIKNFGVWVRYQSRTGYHNAYKVGTRKLAWQMSGAHCLDEGVLGEYRDTTLNGAIDQLYHEMGSRHRCRFSCIQIIKTATVPASACKRTNTQQFLNSKIRFPLTFKKVRPSSRVLKTTFKANRPTTAMF